MAPLPLTQRTVITLNKSMVQFHKNSRRQQVDIINNRLIFVISNHLIPYHHDPETDATHRDCSPNSVTDYRHS